MARPPTKNSFEKNTIKQMKSLGTYRDEFKPIIEIYAGLLFQYHTYAKAHEENDYLAMEEYTNKAGATNMRKVPLITIMETLRKDIISYSDRLMLNPKALGDIVTEENDSPILKFLQTTGKKL
ncbi:P27 family phage terminase small subunit [Gemella sp. 27098_8_92]|uniref:P27 family phage terminase small subunit n=1 Tax=Gemella sp. 27098_8_92 TaxID=3003687 RepID=UPI00352C1019